MTGGISAPRFWLYYRGVDITNDLMPMLIECEYTDHVHGKADEISVKVQDKDGIWRGAWCPEHGDTVRLVIGYEDGIRVDVGTFEIDEPEAEMDRDGDTFSFKGVSAPIKQSLRTKKTKGYENKSLAAIANEVAGEHGLTVTGTPPDVEFERITQRRERPLEFLTRLAEDFGAYFKVVGKQCVFIDRDQLHSKAPVLTIEATSGDYISATLQKGSHKTYSKAKATYFHQGKKKKIEVEIPDPKVTNGDTLRLDDRVENEGQARRKAKSHLQKANLKKQTATIEIPGNPLACSGSNIRLGAGFGKWAGKYTVETSKHKFSRKGYTTHVEINGL
jgi:phage protein D